MLGSIDVNLLYCVVVEFGVVNFVVGICGLGFLLRNGFVFGIEDVYEFECVFGGCIYRLEYGVCCDCCEFCCGVGVWVCGVDSFC